MTYVIIFVCQIMYSFIKIYNTRIMIENNLTKRIVVFNIANIIWLITTSLGVKGILSNDYYIIIPFLLATSIGVIIEEIFRRKKI